DHASGRVWRLYETLRPVVSIVRSGHLRLPAWPVTNKPLSRASFLFSLRSFFALCSFKISARGAHGFTRRARRGPELGAYLFFVQYLVRRSDVTRVESANAPESVTKSFTTRLIDLRGCSSVIAFSSLATLLKRA